MKMEQVEILISIVRYDIESIPRALSVLSREELHDIQSNMHLLFSAGVSLAGSTFGSYVYERASLEPCMDHLISVCS